MKPWVFATVVLLAMLLGFGIHAKFFPCPKADPMVDALAKEAGKRIAAANAHADTVLVHINDPGKPIYIRIHERETYWATAADDSLLARLDSGITAR